MSLQYRGKAFFRKIYLPYLFLYIAISERIRNRGVAITVDANIIIIPLSDK